MQIVVDIVEKYYQNLKSKEIFDDMCLNYYEKRIVYGTPLPKGHGRLIDADELYNSLKFPTQQFASAFKHMLDGAHTIIEANRELGHEYRFFKIFNF